jgi:hypothetical protein
MVLDLILGDIEIDDYKQENEEIWNTKTIYHIREFRTPPWYHDVFLQYI